MTFIYSCELLSIQVFAFTYIPCPRLDLLLDTQLMLKKWMNSHITSSIKIYSIESNKEEASSIQPESFIKY